MKIKMYALKDEKVGFSSPFFGRSNEDMLRSFISTVRSERPNAFNTYPEDKYLYELGEYDDQTGACHNLEKPRMLAHAQAYVVERRPEPQPEQPQKEEILNEGDQRHDA